MASHRNTRRETPECHFDRYRDVYSVPGELQRRHLSLRQSAAAGKGDVALPRNDGERSQAGLFHLHGADHRIRQSECALSCYSVGVGSARETALHCAGGVFGFHETVYM